MPALHVNDPVKDTMRYPCLSPIRPREYPEDEENLEVAKRVVAKTWRSNVDMSCCCKLCKMIGHEIGSLHLALCSFEGEGRVHGWNSSR